MKKKKNFTGFGRATRTTLDSAGSSAGSATSFMRRAEEPQHVPRLTVDLGPTVHVAQRYTRLLMCSGRQRQRLSQYWSDTTLHCDNHSGKLCHNYSALQPCRCFNLNGLAEQLLFLTGVCTSQQLTSNIWSCARVIWAPLAAALLAFCCLNSKAPVAVSGASASSLQVTGMT